MDLRGVVDLLSTAIYSSPQVYLRELIQNAVDAITARREEEPDFTGGEITITPAANGELRLRDDGTGLTVEEVEQFLSTVGSSGKRDIFGLPRSTMLGRFGIGLLSALMVADSIELRTRSIRGTAPLKWIGHADGTYETVEVSGANWPVGTEVIVRPRRDDASYTSPHTVLRLARRYARYLPIPIRVAAPDGIRTINETPPFGSADEDLLTAHGEELLGTRPFATLSFDLPATGTSVIAHVLPHPVSPSARPVNQVYASGMLVTDQDHDVTPQWAFFVRCAINSTGLTPTASRESLVRNETLAATRDAIADQLRAWIRDLAQQHPHLLQAFVATHYLGLKSLVVHDDEIGPLLLGLLPLETSQGERTIGDLLSESAEIRYVPTTDQFRQVSALASHRFTIVNATYTWDAQVLRRIPELVPGALVREISVADVLERLEDVPADNAALASQLRQRAAAALRDRDAEPVIKVAASADLPCFLLTDPDLLRRSERSRARQADTGRWSGVLDALDEATRERDAAAGMRLVLNWTNPVIQRLAACEDEVLLGRIVCLLHSQAIVGSGRPLSSAQSRQLTETLTDLMLLNLG